MTDTMEKTTPEMPGPRSSRKPAARPPAVDATPRERVPSPVEIINGAKVMIAQITGLKAETVSRFARTDQGYSVAIELVEMKTFQGSSDVLATYEVQLDGEGALIDYRRARRYSRNELDD